MVPHFRDETYGDVKTPGFNVWGRIIPGIKRIVPVPDTVGVQGGDMVGRGNDRANYNF
jgi:hypothetical protein